ncbi:MAG: hypothetical protein ACK421_01745 [Pseudanabaenaceae cyanobacterium]
MGRWICQVLTIVLLCLLGGQMVAAKPVVPSGQITGWEWQKLSGEAQLLYCRQAFAAFRGSPAQSYIISHGVQTLTPEGLCDRLHQFYSLPDNRDTTLATAAALAPLLFADTPLGTRY